MLCGSLRGAGQRGLCVSASRRCQRSAEDYWLTLAAGLQVLGFAMLAMDTTSSAAEARRFSDALQATHGRASARRACGPRAETTWSMCNLSHTISISYLESYLNEHITYLFNIYMYTSLDICKESQ